jgi:hypothetical protein
MFDDVVDASNVLLAVGLMDGIGTSFLLQKWGARRRPRLGPRALSLLFCRPGKCASEPGLPVERAGQWLKAMAATGI